MGIGPSRKKGFSYRDGKAFQYCPRELKEVLPRFMCINWVGQGIPSEVRDILSDPMTFGFDKAIHLRLLDVMGGTGTRSNRSLQRSMAEQLGLLDDEDTRMLMEEADENDDCMGVKEEERGVVEEVATRIYRKLETRRCLLVLENVPYEEWYEWRAMGFPPPNTFNGCRVLLSSSPRQDSVYNVSELKRSGPLEVFNICDEWESVHEVARGVAASLVEKTLAVAMTADHVVKSLTYWRLFKPFEPVPVDELVKSWMDVEVLLPSLRSREVGKVLLEELSRRYLLKVSRGDGGVGWVREPLDVRSSGALKASFSWMGMWVEKEEVLLVRADGTVAKLSWGLIASSFRRRPDDDDDHQAGLTFDRWSPDLFEGLNAFFTATGRQTNGLYDLQHLNNILYHLCTPHMRLLDLSYTNISSLPDFLFFRLPKLKVLRLRHCKALETVVAPAAGAATQSHHQSALHSLQVLDLSNSSIGEISDDVLLIYMPNLQVLLLSHVNSLVRLPTIRALDNLDVFRLTHTCLECPFPDEMFECTSRLRVLDLSYNRSMNSLPASLSVALSTLEEIHLQGCSGLRHVEGKGLTLQHMPRLRIFTLSDSSVSQLSLRGCSKLGVIELSNLCHLEELDLSNTGIRELPVEILNLPRLRRLDLLGLQQLRRVPWEAAKRIPQQLNLDQCKCGLGTGRGPAPEEDESLIGKQVSHIFASDPRILRHGNPEWWELGRIDFIRENLPQFYVCISPCKRREEEAARRHSQLQTHVQRIPIPYITIVLRAETMVKKKGRLCEGGRLQRHVEVQGVGDRFQGAASLFLGSADSLSLCDHRYKGVLANLNSLGRWNLKRCRLERCHEMKLVFERMHGFELLETLWISKLGSLLGVWYPPGNIKGEKGFGKLRYVHLEYCPRIMWVFPHNIHLHSLEKLLVKSCPRLKHVFAPFTPRDQMKKATLLGLRAMELLDLPDLEGIHPVGIRSPQATWKLKVRGCWKLRVLPIITAHPSDPGKVVVEIDGEPRWWDRLLDNNTITVMRKK